MEAQAALGRAYNLLAGSLGDAPEKWPEIARLYRKSLDAKLLVLEAEPGNPVYNKSAAAGYKDLGHAYQATGKYEEALHCHRESLAILETMAAADPGNRDLSRAVAIAANGVGSTLVDMKNGAAAVAHLKRSLASLNAFPDRDSIIVPYLTALAHYHLGRAYVLLGRREKRGIAQGEEAALADKAAEALARLR